MNKKGFTLIELLVTILIIAMISGLCVVSYTKIFNRSNPVFYKAIEENLELAANDYVLDHRNMAPISGEAEINLGDLVEEKYSEKVIDIDGNTCSGKIIVFRENKKYKYEVCLDCGKYKSSGPHCQ